MTSIVATSARDRAPSPYAQQTMALTRAELRHVVRSPLLLFGLVPTAIATALNGTGGPSAAFNGATVNNQIVLGALVLLAFHRTTSRAHRDGADELVASMALHPVVRVVAGQLAAVVVALLALVIVLATYYGYLTAGVTFERPPTAAELATQPLVALGAGLLGVMVGRWLPRPAAALGVLAVLVAWSVLAGSGDYRLTGPYVEFARYTEDGTPIGFHPGSSTLHAAYLLLLGAMAAVGGLLHAVRRRAGLLAVGAAVTVLTLLTGVSQLP
ncbi:MAG TPA: hypothetical protein VEZ46_04010 [Mycobacteriales bacterium]|jgi:hypothetical protein|nr:hypothetical protein [Mycobacteriales bacterium]